MTRKFTYEEVKEYFSSQDCQLISTEYKSNKSPLQYFCSCGNPEKSTTTFDKFKNGGCRCQRCAVKKRASKKRHSYEFVAKAFSDSGCILLSTEYIGTNENLEYICNCGNKDEISFNNFRQGHRCKKCRYKRTASKQRHDYAYVDKIFREAGCILLSKDYINVDTPLEYICSCGNLSKISLYNLTIGQRCKKCGIEKNTGENNPKWNPSKTDEERIIDRSYAEYREWIKAVYERDQYTCQCCKKVGGNLRAHHLNGYNWCKERRTDVSNGVTLCDLCHDIQYEGSFHSIYGNGDNTEAQFNEWIESKRNQDAI